MIQGVIFIRILVKSSLTTLCFLSYPMIFSLQETEIWRFYLVPAYSHHALFKKNMSKLEECNRNILFI